MLRKREVNINVRTTLDEKNHFVKNAKKCGLSLSEYFRKLANGYEPKPLPPLEYLMLIKVLSGIYAEFKIHYSPETEQQLLNIILQIQETLLLPGKRDEVDGNYGNMAG